MDWIYENDARFYGHWSNPDGVRAVEFYNSHALDRREKYGFKEDGKYSSLVEQINTNGYCKVEGFFDKSLLLELKKETDQLIADNCHISRRDQKNIVIDQPFLHTETAAKIAFDDSLIDIATSFFNCVPAIGTFNLRRSMANDLPPDGTYLFHRDFNSTVKILKFFFYLNDVNENNGPFTYVEGSNKKMFNGWWRKHRWTEAEMKQIYGDDKIRYLTANVGDVLMARTNGWHKGLKLKEGERTMLTLNYLVHPELASGVSQPPSKRFRIRKEFYDSLPEHKKPVADFLVKV